MASARIKFISVEQLLEMMENGDKFKLIDVLPHESYKEGHIPGAMNIPFDKIEEKSKSLDKNEVFVVYCASYHCHASTNAARTLAKLGFKNVLDFKAGKQGWIGDGLDLEK